MGKVPFSLTFVRYEEGDTIGKAAALLSLAPVFIIVAYATLLVARRELHTLFILVGQLSNVALNGALKRAIGAPRPAGADRDDLGMPSDHAQFMAFWAAYACLFLARRVSFGGRPGWRACLGTAVTVLALLVAGSRVYLGYHSPAQIGVGLVVGALVACGWYALYEKGLRLNAARLLSATRPVSSYLYVQDCSHIPDVLAWEYAAIEAERVALLRSAPKRE
jgi:dolichyldiphosphatase